MFGSAKPAASLSSGLLARKGQARPAMRPQGFVGLEPGVSLDDLGWNDMGLDGGGHGGEMPPVLAQRQALVEEYQPPRLDAAPAPVVAEEAQPAKAEAQPEPTPEPAPQPAATRPVSPATAARIGREVSAQASARGGRAAFTLRLDQDRHLKLRLAAALSGRSAQQVVTGALDSFLESQPELGALIDRLPSRTRR